jgi:hypothetical protein
LGNVFWSIPINVLYHQFFKTKSPQIITVYMEVLQQDNGRKGKFYILQHNREAAKMTYTWAGTGKFIIDHTEVDDVLRGKQAGKQMVMKAVDFARERGVKIMPLCPFASSVFKKMPEIQDVL